MRKKIFLNFGKNGIIDYWDFNIDVNKKLEDQLDDLKEDLVLVRYKGGDILIDLGYYPEFCIHGTFKIHIIKDGNWNRPMKVIECKKLHNIQNEINQILIDLNL